MQCTFCLKYILSDISIARLAFWCLPFAWRIFPSIFFQPICVHICRIFSNKHYYSWVLVFFVFWVFSVHFDNLCLLIELFSWLTLNSIIHMLAFGICFIFYFCLCCCFSFVPSFVIFIFEFFEYFSEFLFNFPVVI